MRYWAQSSSCTVASSAARSGWESRNWGLRALCYRMHCAIVDEAQTRKRATGPLAPRRPRPPQRSSPVELDRNPSWLKHRANRFATFQSHTRAVIRVGRCVNVVNRTVSPATCLATHENAIHGGPGFSHWHCGGCSAGLPIVSPGHPRRVPWPPVWRRGQP